MARSCRHSENFLHAYATFADTPAWDVVDRIIDQIIDDPAGEWPARRRKTLGAVRVYAVPSCGSCPPIRIAYEFNDTTINFLALETYDELAAETGTSGTPGSDQ